MRGKRCQPGNQVGLSVLSKRRGPENYFRFQSVLCVLPNCMHFSNGVIFQVLTLFAPQSPPPPLEGHSVFPGGKPIPPRGVKWMGFLTSQVPSRGKIQDCFTPGGPPDPAVNSMFPPGVARDPQWISRFPPGFPPGETLVPGFPPGGNPGKICRFSQCFPLVFPRGETREEFLPGFHQGFPPGFPPVILPSPGFPPGRNPGRISPGFSPGVSPGASALLSR